jgi:hypothetical protein
VDAKVAAAMCKGGVIAYEIDPLSGISDNWILDYVVPNMVRHGIPSDVCIVFGRAVLFRVFDRTGEDAVPTPMRESIMQAYHELESRNILEDGCNPIKRRPLIVTGYDTEVIIDMMDADDDDGQGGLANGDGDPRRAAMIRNQEVRMLSSQILHLRRELCDARTEGDRQLTIMKRKLARLSNNLTRLSNRPGMLGYKRRRLGNEQGGGRSLRLHSITEGSFEGLDMPEVFHGDGSVEDANDPVPVVPVAKLSKCPRSLFDLWKEYEFGFHGCKAAKDWNASERGADRFKYYKRNVFWVQVSEMVRAGHSADRAIDLIYRAYGSNLSVTKIIKKMIEDKKRGGHPALRTVAG